MIEFIFDRKSISVFKTKCANQKKNYEKISHNNGYLDMPAFLSWAIRQLSRIIFNLKCPLENVKILYFIEFEPFEIFHMSFICNLPCMKCQGAIII